MIRLRPLVQLLLAVTVVLIMVTNLCWMTFIPWSVVGGNEDPSWSSPSIEQVLNDIDDGHLQKRFCGVWKCFYPSKSNPSTGWLITTNSLIVQPQAQKPQQASDPNKKYLMQAMNDAFRAAKQLETTCQIRHVYLKPPQLFRPLTREEWTRLFHQWDKHDDVQPTAPFVAQSVRRIRNNVLLQCKGYHQVKLQGTKRLLLAAANRTKFLEHFTSDLHVALVDIPKQGGGGGFPAILEDFQVLLDEHGHLWHLDMDRIMMVLLQEGVEYRDGWNVCRAKMEKFRNTILRIAREEKDNEEAQATTS